jgi:uncharacterized protein DUF2264
MAEERPLPDCDFVSVQPEPGMVLCRDGTHVFALNAGRARLPQHRNAPAKYGKFCYSSKWAFSVPLAPQGSASCAHDCALALSHDSRHFRAREHSVSVAMDGTVIRSVWRPWEDTGVTTWLIPVLPWHVRVHRVISPRHFFAHEGGFACPVDDDEPGYEDLCDSWTALVRTAAGVSAVRNLCGTRQPEVIRPDPNTHLLFRRTVLPLLTSEHEAGEHWLACAVITTNGEPVPPAPTVEINATEMVLRCVGTFRQRVELTITLHP